jgi:hypothetical protein
VAAITKEPFQCSLSSLFPVPQSSLVKVFVILKPPAMSPTLYLGDQGDDGFSSMATDDRNTDSSWIQTLLTKA